MEYNDQIMPQFCTCHDSSAVMTCAKLWHDWIIIKIKTKNNFTRFQLRAHKPFVKWFPAHSRIISSVSQPAVKEGIEKVSQISTVQCWMKSSWWLNKRQWYLQCTSNGYTAVLHLNIFNLMIRGYNFTGTKCSLLNEKYIFIYVNILL